MARRNRVDPWGDLHAVAARGMLTGNRGCLVDDQGAVARHQRGMLWIACVTEWRGRRHPLDAPSRWTPVFFLDDAVALAAGHRPCGYCRRADYRTYRDAVTRVTGAPRSLRSTALDAILRAERATPGGRGLARAAFRSTWTTDIASLPTGTVVVDPAGRTRLVTADALVAFSFDGWTDPVERPTRGDIRVLTPHLSVGALAHGFVPRLHPSATLRAV